MKFDQQMRYTIVYPPPSQFELIVARFFARWADFGVWFLLLRLILRPIGLVNWPWHFDWFGALLLSTFANAISLHLFGSTMWKSSLGLRVKRYDGSPPSFGQALAREVMVGVLGMGCGIPLLSLLSGAYWGWRVITGRRSLWNRALGLVSVRDAFLERLIARPRGIIVAAAFALLSLTEAALVLFVAGRYEPGCLITGL